MVLNDIVEGRFIHPVKVDSHKPGLVLARRVQHHDQLSANWPTRLQIDGTHTGSSVATGNGGSACKHRAFSANPSSLFQLTPHGGGVSGNGVFPGQRRGAWRV